MTRPINEAADTLHEIELFKKQLHNSLEMLAARTGLPEIEIVERPTFAHEGGKVIQTGRTKETHNLQWLAEAMLEAFDDFYSESIKAAEQEVAEYDGAPQTRCHKDTQA